jgi:hypothetical protein
LKQTVSESKDTSHSADHSRTRRLIVLKNWKFVWEKVCLNCEENYLTCWLGGKSHQALLEEKKGNVEIIYLQLGAMICWRLRRF